MTSPVTQKDLQSKLVPFTLRQERKNPFFQAPLLDSLACNEAIMLARGRTEGKIEGFGDWLRARNGHPLNPDNREVSSQLAGIAESMAEYKSIFGNCMPAHEMRALFMKTATEAIVENEMHKFSTRVETFRSKGKDFAHYDLAAESVARTYAAEIMAKLDAALVGHLEAQAAAVVQIKVA